MLGYFLHLIELFTKFELYWFVHWTIAYQLYRGGMGVRTPRRDRACWNSVRTQTRIQKAFGWDEERIHPPGKGSEKVKRASSISRENDFFSLEMAFWWILSGIFLKSWGNFCLRSPKHAWNYCNLACPLYVAASSSIYSLWLLSVRQSVVRRTAHSHLHPRDAIFIYAVLCKLEFPGLS